MTYWMAGSCWNAFTETPLSVLTHTGILFSAEEMKFPSADLMINGIYLIATSLEWPVKDSKEDWVYYPKLNYMVLSLYF
jgi:hypothetical protein